MQLKPLSSAAHSAIEELTEASARRSALTGYLQLGGSIAIFLTGFTFSFRHNLPTLFFLSFLFVGIVAMIAGLIFFLVINAGLTSPLAKTLLLARTPLNNNAVESDDVTIVFCTRLMLLDAIVCGVLVTSTGGLVHSIFAPLLAGIVTVAVTLRLPRGPFVRVLSAVILAMLTAVTIGDFELRPFSFLRNLPIVPPQGGNYAVAVMVSGLCTLVLTLAGGMEWLFDRLPNSLIKEACSHLTESITNRGSYPVPIQKGFRLFSYDARCRPGGATLSSVHDLRTIIEQAIILQYVLPQDAKTDVRAAIAYLTLAAHWIDDFFDYLYEGIDAIPYQTCTTASVFETSRHLYWLRRRMFRRFRISEHRWDRVLQDWFERTLVPKSLTKDEMQRQRRAIDRGILRGVLAGAVQRCPDRGEDIELTMKRYVQIVVEGTADQHLHQIYHGLLSDKRHWVIIWGTSKLVLDMFDVMTSGASVIAAELYSILFVPLLLFHNVSEEWMREKPLEPFAERICNIPALLRIIEARGTDESESDGAIEPFLHCIELFRKSAHFVQQEDPLRRSGRRNQLKALMNLYGSSLPRKVEAAYCELLEEDDVWMLHEDRQTGRSAGATTTSGSTGEKAPAVTEAALVSPEGRNE